MAEKIVMPQLGESVTEGTIAKWLVKKGDKISKYAPICEVTTDKVNAEVPSTYSGIVGDIIVPEGETVAVGTLICYIEAEGDFSPTVASNEALVDEKDTSVSPSAEPTLLEGKQRYSPAVLKLSQENGVDLNLVKGTGLGGRITRKDILDYIANKPSAIPAAMTHATSNATKAERPAVTTTIPAASSVKTGESISQGDQILPASAVRKTIASRMVQSKHEAPHAWTMVECDVTQLANFREQIKDEFKRKEGISLTYLPFFIKAVVEAIKEFPILNSQWSDGQIILKKSINISIAVATEDALYVPVIKDADQRSIYGIARAIDDLARRTREGKLTVDDMSGGTFTVNNTGSFGSVLSAPIINYPQAAIMSVETIVKRPVILNNMIAIRDIVNLCLSLDHRVLDGLVCGRFLQSVKQKIESYGPDTNLY